MSLKRHLRESFFLKWRFKDFLFLYILKEIADRYGYDTERWLEFNPYRLERDKSNKLQEILKQSDFEKLSNILQEYFDDMDRSERVISGSSQNEIKKAYNEIIRDDSYGYELDRDKEIVKDIHSFL